MRCASIVLPVPGGPLSSALCAPAAAITIALTAWCWPRTSLRSGPGRPGAPAPPPRRSACDRAPARARAGAGNASPGPPLKTRTALRRCSTTVTCRLVDQARLASACARERERAHARALCRVRDRERAPRGPDGAVERQLPEQGDAVELVAGQLSAGGEHRARDRQVEARTGLAHVAGREIGGDAPGGELVAGVEDRRGDALARLAHSGIGEADDREGGQPRAARRPRR